MPGVFIQTFGCQMNKLDAELVLSAFTQEGYSQAASPEEADVILYNTCSVRAHAEERVYSNVGKLKFLKKRKPEIVIGILGCMAQKDRETVFARLPHVDFVCGTREFPRIVEIVEEARKAPHLMACREDLPVRESRDISVRPNKWQAYLTIMRGCDNFCSYCVVPFVRGRELSRTPEEVLEEGSRLAADGVREITLLGQNVNSYGVSFGKKGALAELLVKLNALPGLERIRFVTSHPRDMSREILQAVRDLPKVCEHLHMPAQSGDDRVLNAMNRKYTSSHYRDLVSLAREIVPGIEIASDFIVGFPGETDEEFRNTAAMVRGLRFQNSFIFKYSPRPGTAAAKLADDVPAEVKRRRNLELLDIQGEINLEENRKFIGREVEILVEGPSRRDSRRLSGRTRNNRIVVFDCAEDMAGQLINVRITSATHLTLVGSASR